MAEIGLKTDRMVAFEKKSFLKFQFKTQKALQIQQNGQNFEINDQAKRF